MPGPWEGPRGGVPVSLAVPRGPCHLLGHLAASCPSVLISAKCRLRLGDVWSPVGLVRCLILLVITSGPHSAF